MFRGNHGAMFRCVVHHRIGPGHVRREHDVKGVNLIPQPLRAARSRKRRIRRWMLGCSAYAAALLMSCAVVRALSYADNRTLHADIESTGRRIEDANRAIGNLRV